MALTDFDSAADRLQKLQELERILAGAIDSVKYLKDLPPLTRQYRETLSEIEQITGVKDDDEIGDVLASRAADGKAGAVR